MEFYSFKYFNIQSVKVFATVDAQIVISNQSITYVQTLGKYKCSYNPLSPQNNGNTFNGRIIKKYFSLKVFSRYKE